MWITEVTNERFDGSFARSTSQLVPVMGKSGIHKAWDCRSIVLRSRTEIEETKQVVNYVVTGIPIYGQQKKNQSMNILRLVQEKRNTELLLFVMNLIVKVFALLLKLDATHQLMLFLNNLFKMHFRCRLAFGFNMLAIQNGVPKILMLSPNLGCTLSTKTVVTVALNLIKKKLRHAHILKVC